MKDYSANSSSMRKPATNRAFKASLATGHTIPASATTYRRRSMAGPEEFSFRGHYLMACSRRDAFNKPKRCSNGLEWISQIPDAGSNAKCERRIQHSWKVVKSWNHRK